TEIFMCDIFKGGPLWATLTVFALLTSNGSAAAARPDVPAFPLSDVIAQTQAALDQYNRDPETIQGALPYLTSANFDFKTVTQDTGGGKISFLIFTIGASQQDSVTSDAEFLYQAPPKPRSPAAAGKAAPIESKMFLVTENGHLLTTETGE